MKKTLTLVGLGACMLVVFPSCSSSDDDGFSGDFEEAQPMSTVSVGDDEMPPWLKDDNSGVQVDAGTTTAIPAPAEPVADAKGKASSRQNQPDVAANDEVFVDTTPAPTTSVDPLAGTPVTHTATPPAPKVTTPTVKPKPLTHKAPTKTGKKLSKPAMVIYKVRKGDNLSDIAKRSNTTVAQIRRDSGIKGDLIRPGQIIKVRYTPKGYKPNPKSIKGKGGKAVIGKPGSGKGYVVRKGETISGIAKKNGISTATLLKANNLKAADAAKLRAGQKLVIPKR